MKKLLRVDVTVPDQGDLAERLEAWLAERVAQGWEETIEADGATRFRVHLADAPLARDFAVTVAQDWPQADVRQEIVPEEDWGAAWMQFFTPIELAGTFEILPPWLADKDTEGRFPICIEPKMAFGTGHHATTALCLETFADLAATGRLARDARFLDLGTGSGILGIGLCRLGCSGVGLDIDPQAVWCAVENVRRNRVEDGLHLAVGGVGCLRPTVRFDLVVANILAAPLMAMAGRLTPHLAPGGVLVLSGLLTTQVEAVTAAYRTVGLPEPKARESGEWAALVWQ